MLYEVQTEHQHLVLFEHKFFGKMLMLDGATQVTDRGRVHLSRDDDPRADPCPRRRREVLIVGGGDCGIAEEVLKHKSVRRLTQVEIDASVVEFSKEHFPEFTKPVFADKRFEMVIDDGMKYVAKTDRRFDVIIVNSTDPQGPGKVLFSEKFYAACKRCMTPGGVMVTQNGVPILQPGELIVEHRKFRKLFADGACYVAAIPTYVGGHMAMGWATDNSKVAPASVKTIARTLPEGWPLPDQILDARGARGGVRAAAFHRRERGERKSAPDACARRAVTPPLGSGAVSFATSKLSSISTLFGSFTKICRRGLFGTSLTRNGTPFCARCRFIASKPRLPKATWSMTPESGRCGWSVGEISLRCSTGWPSL